MLEGVRLTPPSCQDLKVLPECTKWLQTAQRVPLADPGKGVKTTPLNT